MIEPFKNIEDTRTLAQAIVDTVREPMLVLDGDLRVVAVSRSYYLTFRVHAQDVLGRPLYALGDGQWRIPALGVLLQKVILERAAMDAFEVEHEFPRIGRRIMLLNARKVFYPDHAHTTLLLAFEDVTERRAIEREKAELLRQAEDLLRQKDVLLQELEHRVANSLQMIASILMLKARTVNSEETRQHLQDAHQRVMAVAAVQEHLHASERHDQIEIGPYLSRLCESLAASMIGEGRPISLKVLVSGGTAVYATAVSLGLIVTELVINALKHAFPQDGPGGQVVVSYQIDGSDWTLVVSDNGIGKPDVAASAAKVGLGTAIVKALAQQLDAKVDIASGPGGVTVSLTHATVTPQLPQTA
ncbi:histidine kinase dimerization/phosphoacceptor domain -containing protein [Methylocapsa polymorpha]|uniref:histidine kinase n=1 Tax=Methylocapsa polymorpha TaxID=3080828 RepID=A0ABZ0HSB8_9HYPH|nr:histidine kinase dimerization/phosphoacceptor domain -containing protein [Methylocapsa sp. RX1]